MRIRTLEDKVLPNETVHSSVWCDTHDRQRDIIDQELLCKTSVVFCADDFLAELALLASAGLGLGKVRLDGQINKATLLGTNDGENLSRLFAAIDKIYFADYALAGKLESVDAIVDWSGSGHGVHDVPMIGASDDHSIGLMEGVRVRPSPSEAVFQTAVALDIIRHLRSNDLADAVLETGDTINYSFCDHSPIGRSALIVGAGATGTYVAIAAGLSGFSRIDVIDPDSVEQTNLARQILYYAAKDLPKATVLSSWLRTIGIESIGVVDTLNEQNACMMKEYDIVFSCVDKRRPRRIMDATAVRNDIILVDGGTDPFTAQVVAYVPGATRCIGFQRDVESPDQVLDTSSCATRKEPSVIIPNMVAGALMTDYALRTLSGKPLPGRMYDSRNMRLFPINKSYRHECGGMT